MFGPFNTLRSFLYVPVPLLTNHWTNTPAQRWVSFYSVESYTKYSPQPPSFATSGAHHLSLGPVQIWGHRIENSRLSSDKVGVQDKAKALLHRTQWLTRTCLHSHISTIPVAHQPAESYGEPPSQQSQMEGDSISH